jgi:hypothetical protein
LAAIVGARSPSYPELATLLALMVGIVLFVVGLLRAGWLATLLSIPITTGFLAGIAVHIIVGELPTLLGIPNEQGHVLVRLVHTLGQVGHTNPYPLGLGAGVLIVTIGTARISSRVPGALIGLVGAGLAVAFFHLGARGVSLLGTLSVRLPGLALPALPAMSELGGMIQLALVVAMVCINCRAIDRRPAGCNVLDPKCDDIATPRPAVDRQIEHCQVSRSFLDLQSSTDRPYTFWPQLRVLADELALIPSSRCGLKDIACACRSMVILLGWVRRDYDAKPAQN